MLKVGIVGLPNAGKTTLFNALTRAGAEVATYPFTTIEKNIGIAQIPDKRLEKIGELLKPKIVTHATTEFVDIAGLVAGASKGEGLGNKFLAHIREVDAILHLVRCFEDVEVSGTVEPLKDIETVKLELALADLDFVEKKIGKLQKAAKSGNEAIKTELESLQRIKDSIQKDESIKHSKGYNLLTTKPCLYLLNLSEKDLTSKNFTVPDQIRNSLGSEKIVLISAKIEEELSELERNEREEYRKELGIEDFTLDVVIEESYNLLNLIKFYTIKGEETRAWSIKEGSKIIDAAYKIHTDMGKGFIRAEVFSYDDLLSCSSVSRLKDAGLLKIEGRDYLLKDGDIVLIKFH